MLYTNEDSADEQSVNTFPREGSTTEESSVGTLPNEDQDHGFTEEGSMQNNESRQELNVSFADTCSATEKSDSLGHPSSFNTSGDPRFGSAEGVPCLRAGEHKATAHNGDVLGTLSPWTRNMEQRDSSIDSSETHVNRERSGVNKENAIAAAVGAIEFAPSPQGSSDLEDSATSVEHMDIAQFPTNQLLEMLTGLLYKIVKSNDQLKPFEQDKHDLQNVYVAHVLSFRGKHIPAITLGDYFSRIQKYCPITNDVFLSLLVYFDRIAKRCNAMDPQLFVMDSYNIHRLIIAAVTVSTKFFSDFFYSNSRYARVGGISLQELNRLELQFSILCDFELIVSVQELQRYADLLYKFWNRENRGKVLANSL